MKARPTKEQTEKRRAKIKALGQECDFETAVAELAKDGIKLEKFAYYADRALLGWGRKKREEGEPKPKKPRPDPKTLFPKGSPAVNGYEPAAAKPPAAEAPGDPTEALAELALVVGKLGGIEATRRALNTLETIVEAMRP